MSMVIPKRSERKYEPYPEYKDSGVEWLGEIPAHWSTNRIKFTTYVKGRIGWHGLRSDEFCDEGPFLVTGTDFINGRIDWNTCYHISEERYMEDPYIHLREDDLLITKDGSIGKIALVKNIPFKASLNSGVFLTRPLLGHYITDFMYWVLQSGVFSEYIEYIKAGSTIQHLYQETFENLTFPIPSDKEQQAIADFLDRETARIDELIARKQRLIELLQEQRIALITRAVTKGLNQNVPMEDSGVEWLGEIPAHWEVKKLKYVAEIVTGNTPPKTDPENYDELEGLPWVKPDNLGTFLPVSESQECLSAKGAALARVVPKEAVLTCCIGSIGSIGIAGCELTTNQQINSVIFTGQRVHHKYGFYVVYASLPEYRKLANLNVVAIISSQSQKTIRIPLPPLPEQQAIADYLDQETVRIDSLVSRTNQAIEKLQEYRYALITAAITGKIDVR